MPARSPLHTALLLVVLVLSQTGCALHPTAHPLRIALVAPFEGTYRHVGYDALYAARLALTESRARDVELLPIDDGGTPVHAAERAAALAADPQTHVVIVLGLSAVQADVLARFADLPVIIAGNWGQFPASESVFLLSAVTGSLSDALFFEPRHAVTMTLSSGRWPDENFVRRYQADQAFAPQPTPTATLVYDAVGIAIQAMQTRPQRAAIRAAIADDTYLGYNGSIDFHNQVWQDAPVYRYRLRAGEIQPVDSRGAIVNPV